MIYLVRDPRDSGDEESSDSDPATWPPLVIGGRPAVLLTVPSIDEIIVWVDPVLNPVTGEPTGLSNLSYWKVVRVIRRATPSLGPLSPGGEKTIVLVSPYKR